MLTVQQTLKKIDPEELISSYVLRLLSDPIRLLEVPDDVTFGDFMTHKRHNASIIVDNLLNAKTVKDSDAILIACHRYDSDLDDIEYELVEKKDISGKDWTEKAQGYCYMAEPFEEIAAYKIADTYLTQRNLIGLLTDVMYEASWFGPNQEGRQQFIDDLDERMNSKEEAKPIKELWKSLEDKYGWTPEKRSPKQEKAERDLNMKVYEYNRMCFLDEVRNLRKSLGLESKHKSKSKKKHKGEKK